LAPPVSAPPSGAFELHEEYVPALAPAMSPPAGALDLLEAVTLDFSAPIAGEDADSNLDTADLDLEVTYASESNFYADLAGTDLGLFVATFVVKAVGTPLAIRLTVPQLDEPVRVTGTVRWVREFSPSIEAPPGMGVALSSVSGRTRNAIDAFMQVRPPLLHDD
jgi:Tfp pilus assembly protein PilZ